MVLGFRADRVERALARRGRAAPEAPRAVPLPLDRPPGSTLHSFARWIFHEFERAGSDEAFSPAFAVASERTLLAMLLECILGQPPLPHRRPELSGAQLTRIDGWIAAHARDDVGVRDIARAAGVSVRTLRDGLREARGLTPKQALLQRRLQEARAMLMATGPDAPETVTQVALGCGFEHLGRFSRAYAEAFGERPSQTLARARRGAALEGPATTWTADGE